MEAASQGARSNEIPTKVALLYQKRAMLAQERFGERLCKAYADWAAGLTDKPVTPIIAWSQWSAYATDFAQRSILFGDTLRERADHPDEPRRLGDDATRFVRRRSVGGEHLGVAPPERRWPDMAGAIAVLNAGSSSHKFSVFTERDAEFELAARGQADRQSEGET